MDQFFRGNVLKFLSRYSSQETSNENQNESINLRTLSSNNHDDSHSTERNGYKEKGVINCRDLSEVFHLFDSLSIREELDKVDETLLLKIQIDQRFGTLSPNEQQTLSKKFRNKSIVIVFTSRSEDKSSIHWKSKEIPNFLTLSPYTDTPIVTEKKFYDFISRFLAISLANGHLGILSSVQKSAEKGGNVELHLIADHRDFNLLLCAAESGQNDIVKILLEQNLETVLCSQNQEITAQDLAWDAHQHSVVLTLIKAGEVYPKSFNISECSTDLMEFCRASEELHAAILANNETEIHKILNQTQHFHSFYNRINESAAKIALNAKMIDIYKLLTSRKVFLGRHEILHDFWENFSEIEKEMLRKIHFKNSVHMPEKHLNDLTNCSSVSHDDKNVKANINLAQYAFGILNQIASIRIILMIVAASKKLKILFDFKSTSVDVVDPTAESNTRGMFYIKGIICVAAGFLLNQSTEHETFGTLAHELCHYAMILVYRNSAKPYKQKDREKRREFAKIVEMCEQKREKEHIIDMTFHYPSRLRHAELIVRVPHLIALYHNRPEKLKEARENFSELFNYYEKYVIPDMERSLPRIEKEIYRMDRKILKNKIIAIVTVILSIIIIVAGFFVTRSAIKKDVIVIPSPVYSFGNLSLDNQAKIRKASVNYKDVQIQFQDLFSNNSSAYEMLTTDHISQMLDEHPLNFSDPFVHYLDELVIHKWENLTEKLKKRILSSNFTFQNISLRLENLHAKIPKAFKVLTSDQIIELLDGNAMIIDRMIPNRTAFYVERSFKDDHIYEIYYAYPSKSDSNKNDTEEKFRKFYENFENQNASKIIEEIEKVKNNSKFKNSFENFFNFVFTPVLSFTTFRENFDDVLKKTLKLKIFILSSEAGTGKTTTFEQFTIKIKEKYPTRWVSYIDLKDHTKFYNKHNYLENSLGLLEEILGLNSGNEFKKYVFEELFMSGGVVLVWNGFDEISPTYSSFILNVLNSIHKNTENIQFVCTRPLYKDQLFNQFGVNPRTLVPLDKENQVTFLNKFFSSVKIDEEKFQNYTDKVYKIVNALNGNIDFKVPLMLEMIANLISHDVEIYESENLFEIYQKFIKKKIEIWEKKSEFFSKFAKNSLTDYRNFDMMQMYQMYALKSEIPGLDFKAHMLSKKLKIMRQNIPQDLTSDETSRMGILYINGENIFKFAHKTFAEFFVAQFFIENIYLQENVVSEDIVLIIQLFFDITERYGDTQVIITNFIKSFLQLQNTKENEVFGKTVADILRTNFGSFFFNLLRRQKSDIFDFLFDFFKKDHKLLVDLLQIDENETFYTASFNRVYFNNFNINRTRLKELGKNYLTPEESKKYIHGKNQKGIILLSLYFFYREDMYWKRNKTVINDDYDLDEQVLRNDNSLLAFESIAKNLTESELKELLISFSSPVTCLHYNFNFVEHQTFWNIIDNSLTLEEKKILISNFFYRVSTLEEYHYSIPFLMSKTEEYFTKSEIFEIFSKHKILHRAASAIGILGDFETGLWNFFTNHTTENQQKEILLQEIDRECFIFSTLVPPNQKCYDYPPLNILKIILILNQSKEKKIEYSEKYIYTKYFNNTTEMQNIILKSNDFLPYFVEMAPPTECKEFVNYLKKLFNGTEHLMKEFLLRKIEPTNLDIFHLMEGVYSFSEKLKPLSDFLESIGGKS